MIPGNGRDVRDNENRVMYNDRESVTLLKGDVERPDHVCEDRRNMK